MSIDLFLYGVALSSVIAPRAPRAFSRGNRCRFAGRIAGARLLIGTAVILAAAASGCRTDSPSLSFQLVPVERRDLLLSVMATGVIQPDTTVMIKSQASGEVLAMKVGEGQLVQRDSVMAEIDQRTPRNTLLQAEAAVEVAKARLATEEETFRRADELFETQSINQQEHDSLALSLTDTKAAVVAAALALDDARIALAHTDVRAPITGTVLTTGIERGQMVSSPSQNVGGGTMLFEMADLTHLQVKVEVDETDIGKIRPGIPAAITALAYPDRVFGGTVLKVEPQSDSVYSVPMFAVLVRVLRPSRLLMPGMTADVEFRIAERKGVVAVPNAALEVARTLGPGRTIPGDSGIVFVERSGVPTPVEVETGLTDLDYSEVLRGLSTGDSVLVRSSAFDDKLSQALSRRLQRLSAGPGP